MLSIIISPIAGAIIGYFTNWVAIKMLFRPHTEKRLFGLRLPFTPGLIPKERFALSKKIGETLKNNVLTEDVMRDYITSADTKKKLEMIINEKVDEFFAKQDLSDMLPPHIISVAKDFTVEKFPSLVQWLRTLPEKNPAVDDGLKNMVAKIARENFGSFIGIFVNYDKIYDSIKNNVFEYLEEPANQTLLADKCAEGVSCFLSSGATSKINDDAKTKIKDALLSVSSFALEKLAGKIAAAFEVDKIVETKINEFSVQQAETLIISVVNRELNAITALGGLLGFIIGWVPALTNLIVK